MAGFARLFGILSIFFGIVATLYGAWVWLYDIEDYATDPSAPAVLPIEWVGTVSLSLCSLFALLIAFYLLRAYRAQGGELPEDVETADIDDGEAEQGHFSPWSWWPITLAAACALVVLGLAIGPWISAIGVGVLAISVTGWVFEYYRGRFSR